ncbi:MAG: hypothetical protein ACT4OO_03180 [Nitrospiraceae bacterium]
MKRDNPHSEKAAQAPEARIILAPRDREMVERTLLLSWTVPPETTGSAVIVGNLAKQFTRVEMVIAGERPHERPAVAWKDEWPEIIYLTTGWPHFKRGARWWRRAQVPVLVLRALRLIRRYRCTRLLVVFPSEEFLLAGYWVAHMTGAKLYAYFHNTYLEQREPGSLGHRFAKWLQSRVFAQANHIFVMSEGIVELYRERYPNLKCSALVHSFNEDIPEVAQLSRPASPPRFVMCGNINASCEDAVVRVCRAITRLGGSLTILSGTPRTYLSQLGILHGQVRYETVSRDVVVNRLGEADIVLLAHGFTGPLSDKEYRTIFPTKTIEYLICGRPILAHAPADCYLTRFLRERGCALIVDEPSEGAVLAAIRRLSENDELRTSLVRNALRTSELFRAPVVAGALRSVLERS